MKSSFDIIFLLFALVVPLVTGLFFLIITLQKSRSLTLLRAIGAPASVLVRALLIQVLIILGGGILIGTLLYAPLSQTKIGSLSLRFDPTAVLDVGRPAAGARRGQRVRRDRPRLADRSRRGDHRGGRAMKLALRELWRRPGRFVVATVILTLIALLLMFLGGLLDGLVAGSTGALRAQRGQLIVYSTDVPELARAQPDHARRPARRSSASRDPANVGGLGSVQLGSRVPGHGPRDLVPVVLMGYELAPRGLPGTPPPDGEAYADRSLESQGVRSRHGRSRSDRHARPSRSSDSSTTRAISGRRRSGDRWPPGARRSRANRPGERVGPGRGAGPGRADRPGPRRDARAIDAATSGATTTLTIGQAIDALPGVSQQQTVFDQIIGVTVVIAIVVVALFFALITIERTALYGVLKALGASSATLFWGVLLQALDRHADRIGDRRDRVPRRGGGHPPGTIPFVATPAAADLEHRIPGDRRRDRLCLLAASRPPRRSGRSHRRRPVSAPITDTRHPHPGDPHARNRHRCRPASWRASARHSPCGDDVVVALDGVDLTVGHDEILALVGPSGSGKTTLCSIAGGLLTPTEGSVVVGGQDISRYCATGVDPISTFGGRLRLSDRQPGAVPDRTREPAGRATKSARAPARGPATVPTSCSRSLG